ncbi:MFS transporter [Sneathiella marina]|uniref:MFS transporter n=1 Tax=Sneathiella marina TaxID=2950108 RepID=A0ABY4W3M1_9PROT|nr:MFS transporter [Sneathiella marina]USG61509.1 MFS transporter [Sneathiella marina]
MNAQKLRFTFLNFGHFVDHLFMLIFAKAAFSAGLSFGLAQDGAYAEMIPYGIPSLVLFGACAPIAAHLADKWQRNGMIAVFFIGIGASAIATSFAQSPLQMAFGLAAIGVFAAIYHPVGIAMIIQGGGNIGWRLGANGVWGNMGVAAAPLLTGFILADYNWQLAFIVPGVLAILTGIGFIMFVRRGRVRPPAPSASEKAMVGFMPGWPRALLAIAMVTSAGGFVFGTMTFVIPRMFEVSMPDVTVNVATTGLLAALVYALAAFAQLVVGRLIDRHDIRTVLLVVAIAQPLLIGVMSIQINLALFFSTLAAMAFVFGQIPITDAVISRYVPDVWRAKILSVKLLLNLVIGALALLAARFILESGEGFDRVMVVAALTACCITGAALLLPSQRIIDKNLSGTPAE